MFSYTFYKSLISVKYTLMSSKNRLFLQARNCKNYLKHMPTTYQLIRQTSLLCKHRQLGQAWANAQSHQGIRCLHKPQIHCCAECTERKAVHVDRG